jgi:hypothetical protein
MKGAHKIGFLNIDSFSLSTLASPKEIIEYTKTVAQVNLILIKDFE